MTADGDAAVSSTLFSRFSVEPRLIIQLGAQYRSIEEALKELVANAWDADATLVEISLPELALGGDPIIVRDNGCGMTPGEIASQYLRVAYDRRKHQGAVTPQGRTVRGYRGIGKFAGLIAADVMTVTSVSRGVRTRLILNRADLEGQSIDLEAVELRTDTEMSDAPQGTTIELSGLRQTFHHPSPARLAAVLLREFGKRDDFIIVIDGETLTPDAVQGVRIQMELPLSDEEVAGGTVWLLDRANPVAEPGVLFRVNGRAIGAPTFFGLDRDPDIPRSLLNRVYGELDADHLADDVMSNWAGFIENSKGYDELREAGAAWLKDRIQAERDREAGATQDEFIRSYARQLELLPVARRDLARQQLLRVFQRFYDDALDRKRRVADLVLSAFEEDEYRLLIDRINHTSRDEIVRLADVLHDWGITELTELVARARQRLAVVDAFEALASNAATLELSGVHKALEAHPWLVGDQYELWKSNQTMRRICAEVSEHPLGGRTARQRPDLILVGLQDRHLLIELKRPSHELTRRDIAQAEEYRDTLRSRLRSAPIHVLVIGGTVERNLPPDDRRDVTLTTFDELILASRARLRWLCDHLAPDKV